MRFDYHDYINKVYQTNQKIYIEITKYLIYVSYRLEKVSE